MTVSAASGDPSATQRLAADPLASIWVSASAGSGKTKVLTDRVLSLLLQDVGPERILGLTFTKAAAAEMANRISGRLGNWAVLPNEALVAELTDLVGKEPDADLLTRARRLFARVIDAPGGLKIQTIHAFCQSLLGRFPIEAELAPHFEVIDERSAAELIEAARDTVLARTESDMFLRDALAAVTDHVDELRFAELMTTLGSHRHRLDRFIADSGGSEHAISRVYGRLGLSADETDESLRARAASDSAFDRQGLRAAAEALLQGTEKTDQPRGRTIADWLARDDHGRVAMFDTYTEAFLTAAGAIRKSLATAGLLSRIDGLEATLSAEAVRISAVQDQRRALVTAQATSGLIRLGSALLEVYAQAKRFRARLDYDDLILKTRDLLGRPGIAPWVLYKLDGGIDHILIDEAQDTSPEQWAVIAALAEEFFTGQGAQDRLRTVFAVGDVKQSIFSFQHADPEEFRRMKEYFGDRVSGSEAVWRSVELDISFRSTRPVLEAVDLVFARPQAADGVIEPGKTLRHFAHRKGDAGRVELWPLVTPAENDREEESWSPPVARRGSDDPKGRLARVLASRISGWIGNEVLPSRGRPLRASDILVLVRTRTAFVEMLVRALKDLGVPVSGIDRMVLTDQIAVMDLIALGQFLLLPDDDLTLATVLKGPLIGLNDEELFRLAYDRGRRSLWQRLGQMAASEARVRSARDWLADLLSRVDFVRPYELFADILSHPTVGPQSGRQRMLSRLGPDADDPMDEFLNLALFYERSEPASLQGFLHWVEAGEATIKRDLEQAGRDEVRVMTVHGSKGLQAPIVILPDTTSKPRAVPPVLWDGDVPVWPPRSEYRDPVARELLESAAVRRDREYRRLLYVAMTRAEDRLYVCGAAGKTQPPPDCWFELVRAALVDRATAIEVDFTDHPEGWNGSGLRLDCKQEAEPRTDPIAVALEPERLPVEDWMSAPAPAETAPPRPLAPSRPLQPEPPVRSPLVGGEDYRFRRGLLIHRLLETLPALPPEDRRATALGYLARHHDGLGTEEAAQIADEVLAVLEDSQFAALFGPGSRAETPITGLIDGPDGAQAISGQVDRLVVTAEAVLIVDYKSNRPPPQTVDDVPDEYWRQMGAYRAILTQIFPDRPVKCALLWTDGPILMPLSGPRLDHRTSRP